MPDDKITARERKWQDRWAAEKCFVPKNDGSRPRFYYLLEFPFLSGAGMHAGHMLTYSGIDIMSRWRRRAGYDVLFPIGFDAMGITAEHYAVRMGRHPADIAAELKQSYLEVIRRTGWSVNTEAAVATSDPEFIRWTQWMFIQFFNAGLAYKSFLPMNWCPSCRTTLTNEELEDGKCDRCHGPVEKREKMQWNLALSRYAQKLLDGLETVDFIDRVKRDEINMIGRSDGAEIDFHIEIAPRGGAGAPAPGGVMTVYTTRADTVFGASFCVLAPEHALVGKWLDDGAVQNAGAVRDYAAAARAKSEIERLDATREKTGVRLDGVVAINPFNGAQLPVFIADYVLADYGNGAIMAVPAHDDRDMDFARKYNLPVIPVLDENEIHINSEFMNGLNIADAKAAAIKSGLARASVQYKLKDWAFSRQMYWGEPIPLVHCEKCGWVPVPDDQLPVLQPHMLDYRPTLDGDSPLARATDWVNTTCPRCGGAARRETDTMPGWAGSSWYYMRYLDPKNDREFCSRAQMENWLPVNHYNGGNEHNTKHLIYSRFWHHALYDLGLVNTPEPYARRTAQGLLMGSDGHKMSKSRGNGFMAADLVDRVGADVARMAVVSLGAWTDNTIWSEGAVRGAQKFLSRVEKIAESLSDGDLQPGQERLVHELIKNVGERIEAMSFNTAISAMMEFVNKIGDINKFAYEILLQCLNPFAPHITEELWEKLGHAEMLVFAPWPEYDEAKLVRNQHNYAVSVNGKFRGEFITPDSASDEERIAAAKGIARKFLDGHEIIKTIHVPNKMINFVIR
ncbi:MAG: leucine--tRNA ligase [Rickettsiales bacterium]|jgi:leucyl-tRNA synthetase|nr:leucine--tRNA ligase [Rickettsiales bacterium]